MGNKARSGTEWLHTLVMNVSFQGLDRRIPGQVVQSLARHEDVRLQIVHHRAELLRELRPAVLHVRRQTAIVRPVCARLPWLLCRFVKGLLLRGGRGLLLLPSEHVRFRDRVGPRGVGGVLRGLFCVFLLVFQVVWFVGGGICGGVTPKLSLQADGECPRGGSGWWYQCLRADGGSRKRRWADGARGSGEVGTRSERLPEQQWH